eukprot:732796_1
MTNLNLSKYNVNSNTWSTFAEYPLHFHSKHQSFCKNNATNELYLYGSKPTMLKINTATQQTNVISHALVDAGMYAPSCIIKGQFHLMAGHKNTKHFVLNEEQHAFEEMYEFSEWNIGNVDPGLVNITSQQKLMLFGGYDFGKQETLDAIWIFDYATSDTMKQGWTKIENVRLPKGTLNSGYTMSVDQTNVFIFGGSKVLESEFGKLID